MVLNYIALRIIVLGRIVCSNRVLNCGSSNICLVTILTLGHTALNSNKFFPVFIRSKILISAFTNFLVYMGFAIFIALDHFLANNVAKTIITNVISLGIFSFFLFLIFEYGLYFIRLLYMVQNLMRLSTGPCILIIYNILK